MHIRSVVGIGGIGLLTLGVEVSSGDIITPVLAFASSYYNSNLSPTQAINNAGLNMTSGDILTWTHTAPQDGWQTWITGQGQGGGGSTAPTTANQYIVFDLGNNYDLTDAYIWQLVQGNLVDRGLKDFRLLASPNAPSNSHVSNPPANYDLTGFTEILSPSVLTMGTANVGPTAQVFALSNATNVRQIYLDINSAHSGASNSYVGISEIKFEGMLSPVLTHHWINASGGSWQAAGNWSTSSLPASNQDATFDLDATYTVTLAQTTSIRNLNVSAGHVTITPQSSYLMPGSINVDGGKLTVRSLDYRTGGPGYIILIDHLNVTDGTFEIAGGVFNPGGQAKTISGTSYSKVWVLSGNAGSTDLPRLELNNGGHSTGSHAVVIGADGGRGAAQVQGTGSTLRTDTNTGLTGQLVIGTGGAMVSGSYQPSEGWLEVVNGGTAHGYRNIHIGQNGGKGFATVDGVNSTLTSGAGDWFYIGTNRDAASNTASEGTLIVRNGGSASGHNIAIGHNGGVGHALVTGAGSSLVATHSTGGLGIGYRTFGQEVTSGHLTVTDNATAIVPGALIVGYGHSHATGTLDILNGGKVHTTNASTSFSSVGHHANGTINIDGAGSLLTSASQIFHVGYGSDGNGVLNLTNGGEFRAEAEALIGAYGGTGHAIVGKSDGTDTRTALLSAGELSVSTTNQPHGTLTVHPKGRVEVSGTFSSTVNRAGSVNLLGGTIKAGSIDISALSNLNWTSGTLWLDGGWAWIGGTSSTFVVPAAGTLQGSGTIQRHVRVEGTIAPGELDDIATLSVRNFTLGTASVAGTLAMNVDLNGSTADLLSTTGTVNLTNAVLDLSLIGFDPDFQDLEMPRTYLLIQNDASDAVLGSFAAVLGDWTDTLEYSLDYAFLGDALNGVGTGNDVAITFYTVIPEPTGLTLPLIAGLGLLARRRRSR